MRKLRIGIIGCGMISDIYVKNIRSLFPSILEAYSCSDVIEQKSIDLAKKFDLISYGKDELLNDPNVDIVLNLTIPAVHAQISREALLHHKHVYSEKPLAINLEEAIELENLAKSKDLSVGCAPDTFLGGAIQSAKALIDKGLIGQPISATAFLLSRGPEVFHPNPGFFYQKGGGPLLDMGPYYVTALISLLGPVKEVTGIAKMTYDERVITGKVNTGKTVPVYVDTFINGLMRFENETIANLTTTWDMDHAYWNSNMPYLQIFGSKGSIKIPDPNGFGGLLYVKNGDDGFTEFPLTHGYTDNSRALGLADMAYAIQNKVKVRASSDLALHVLEVLTGILDASHEKKFIQMKYQCQEPNPVSPSGFEFDIKENNNEI